MAESLRDMAREVLESHYISGGWGCRECKTDRVCAAQALANQVLREPACGRAGSDAG